MAIKLNDTYVKQFIAEDELAGMAPQIKAAQEMLTNRSGLGNDFLGWIDLPVNYDREEFARIEKAAEKIRNDSDVLIVIGIGGSYLGARAAIELLKSPFYNNLKKDTPDIYFVGNNINPTYLNEILSLCEGKDVSVNIISKSGTTTEPALAFRVFREFLINKYGAEEAKKRIYATTDKARGTLKELSDAEKAELVKEDAQQAQIIQGWLVPTIGSDDYFKIMLLNTILGASGLSSRLFMELREKKGLAYTVRTSYETHQKAAVFSIYIGTEPSNIETSISGFKEEIEKIKRIPVSEEELHNAKNNIIGKQQFITETNSQQANLMAYYSISGKPFDYQKEVVERLKSVTSAELLECANKYFTDNFVIAVLRP